jgi:hypothetical protein
MDVKVIKSDQKSELSSKKSRPKTAGDKPREQENLGPVYDESTLQSERSKKSVDRKRIIIQKEEDEENKRVQEEEMKRKVQEEEEIFDDEEDEDDDDDDDEDDDGIEEEDIEEIDITEDPLYQVLSAVLEDEDGNNIVESVNELRQAVLINTQYLRKIAHAIEKLAEKK